MTGRTGAGRPVTGRTGAGDRAVAAAPTLRCRREGPLARAALAAGGRATLVAVQPRAAVLRLEPGALVSILPAGCPLHPWAVEVAGGVAGLSPAASPRLERESARAVDLRLRERPRRLPVAALRAPAAATAGGRGDPRGDGGFAVRPGVVPGTRGTGPFDPGLEAAVLAFVAGGEAAALADLVGLGEGLTPSGDDVLTGILAGLDLLRDASPAAATARDHLAAALGPGRLERTSRLSAQMVAAAGEGFYPEPLLEVLRALAAAAVAVPAEAAPPAASGPAGPVPPSPLAAAAWRLAAVGHRSGRDMLLGLRAALFRFGESSRLDPPGRGPRAGSRPRPRRG